MLSLVFLLLRLASPSRHRKQQIDGRPHKADCDHSQGEAVADLLLRDRIKTFMPLPDTTRRHSGSAATPAPATEAEGPDEMVLDFDIGSGPDAPAATAAEGAAAAAAAAVASSSMLSGNDNSAGGHAGKMAVTAGLASTRQSGSDDGSDVEDDGGAPATAGVGAATVAAAAVLEPVGASLAAVVTGTMLQPRCHTAMEPSGAGPSTVTGCLHITVSEGTVQACSKSIMFNIQAAVLRVQLNCIWRSGVRNTVVMPL